jgi:His-Xaa-Ser system radical SAM maturase HxsC
MIGQLPSFITGGEPTLPGDRLLRIIRAQELSADDLSAQLSNGRLFSYLSLCQAITEIGHPDFMIGIPVYSDIAGQHDFVVQAKGAFDQTIRGIMNLKRCKQRVEIRVVLHRYTTDRLPQLATFIARNLPMVDHVALMGLELMGYTRMNLDALWIDPADYQDRLAAAVHTLARSGLEVSIYNHQLCVLRRDLWPFARKSISDWKNEYVAECEGCAVKENCGGFFSSGLNRYSRKIRALSKAELATCSSQ